MDKTTKVIISTVGGLGSFVISKELILSLIISVWLLFALFPFPSQIFVFFSIFFLIYYVVFKTISLSYVAIMVILGLLLTVIAEFTKSKKPTIVNWFPDTKTISLIIIFSFFLFALLFSYQTYQKQQLELQQARKEKPVENVIINLNK